MIYDVKKSFYHTYSSFFTSLKILFSAWDPRSSGQGAILKLKIRKNNFCVPYTRCLYICIHCTIIIYIWSS